MLSAVRLFDRSTRHVALTSAGELLVRAGRRILVEVDAALEEVRQAAAGRHGRLVLAVAIAVHGAPVVRESIRRFSDLAPAIELQVIGYDHADPTAGISSASSQAG